ncbi:MAG TPA: dihydrofolate reductase [Xanthobacteraceae bacterium]|nr:dihydrofolate reductase [Xanthobacteraceae bacterium]
MTFLSRRPLRAPQRFSPHLVPMAGPQHIIGYAIVSADGMIADASGVQPDALRIEADQKFFYQELARSDAVVHGRNSRERGPCAAKRPRLIMTRRIPGLGRVPQDPNAVLWNPAGASLADAWSMLAPPGGTLAVIGGTEVYGHFLEVGFDTFYLTRAGRIRLPGGRPLFPGVPTRMPEELLASHGLKDSRAQVLDPEQDVMLVVWRRRHNAA